MSEIIQLKRGQTSDPAEMAVWVSGVMRDPGSAEIGRKTPLGTSRLQSLTGLERISATALNSVIDVIRNAPEDSWPALIGYISGFPDDVIETIGGLTSADAELYFREGLEDTVRPQRVKKLTKKAIDGPDFTDSEGAKSANPEDSEPDIPVRLNGTDVSEDGVKDWLDHISKIPLLSAEQEVQIARRIEAGLAARAALERWVDFETTLETLGGSSNGLDRKSLLQDLEEIARDGEDAKQQMITANLRLVVSTAKKYQGRGLSLLDLIQEGNIGLIRAVEKFDHTKGYKFSTYATWWIQQALQRGIANSCSTVRLPVNVHGAVRKMQAVRARLADDLGREPSDEELAETLDWPLSKLWEYEVYGRNSQNPLSLSLSMGRDNDDATLGDFVANKAVSGVEEESLRWQLAEHLGLVLGMIGERDADVIRMRFGLNGSRPKTLEEVGNFFGVTRERVRQIENKAMQKLRHTSLSSALRGYLEDL